MATNPLAFILINPDLKTDRDHKARKTGEWKIERDQIFRDWQQLWQEIWLIFWWDVIWRDVSWLVLRFQKNYQNQCAHPKEGQRTCTELYQSWTFPCETSHCFIKSLSHSLIYLFLMSFVGGTDSQWRQEQNFACRQQTGGKWAHRAGEETLLVDSEKLQLVDPSVNSLSFVFLKTCIWRSNKSRRNKRPWCKDNMTVTVICTCSSFLE